MPGSASPLDSIKNHDLLALRSFVTAQDGREYENLDRNLVVVDITHSNLQQRHVEVRLNKHADLASLRLKIHQTTGTSAQFQHLQVFDADALIADLPPSAQDNIKLGAFLDATSGLRIHCTDLNPLSESAGGGYEDTNLVEKFRLTDAEYNARQGTLRAWNREQKAINPDFSLRKHAAQHRALVEAKRQHRMGLPLPDGFVVDSTGQVVADEPDVATLTRDCPTNTSTSNKPGAESVSHVTVGSRCQVMPGQRRGRVAFVGEIPELGEGGHWVGIALDEPMGKHDGTVPGTQKRLFETMDKYGVYCRGARVECGDFPVDDIFSDDSSSEEEL